MSANLHWPKQVVRTPNEHDREGKSHDKGTWKYIYVLGMNEKVGMVIQPTELSNVPETVRQGFATQRAAGTAQSMAHSWTLMWTPL